MATTAAINSSSRCDRLLVCWTAQGPSMAPSAVCSAAALTPPRPLSSASIMSFVARAVRCPEASSASEPAPSVCEVSCTCSLACRARLRFLVLRREVCRNSRREALASSLLRRRKLGRGVSKANARNNGTMLRMVSIKSKSSHVPSLLSAFKTIDAMRKTKSCVWQTCASISSSSLAYGEIIMYTPNTIKPTSKP